MKKPIPWLPAILLLTAFWNPATASDPLVYSSGTGRTSLVELYTSEGCSSCPPADRWVSSLKEDPRLWKQLVPIAFHVDYWDYIGWKDPFASPDYSQRQRTYGLENAMRTIYTPGFFVDGDEWKRWAGLRKLPLQPDAPAGELRIEIDDGHVRAVYTPVSESSARVKLHVALLGLGLESEVSRGENAGRRLEHDFVALTSHHALMEPAGRGFEAELELETPSTSAPSYAIAAWVTPDGSQRPLQAVGGWLPAP